MVALRYYATGEFQVGILKTKQYMPLFINEFVVCLYASRFGPGAFADISFEYVAGYFLSNVLISSFSSSV